MARTDAGGISGRTAPSLGTIPSAKFSRVKTVASASFFATGSQRGASGFIIKSAGNVMISPTVGDAIQASDLTVGTLYEIGVHQITGSGITHLVY
jgi:hypothetical protein